MRSSVESGSSMVTRSEIFTLVWSKTLATVIVGLVLMIGVWLLIGFGSGVPLSVGLVGFVAGGGVAGAGGVIGDVSFGVALGTGVDGADPLGPLLCGFGLF